MVAGIEHCQFRAAIEVLVPYSFRAGLCGSQIPEVALVGSRRGGGCHNERVTAASEPSAPLSEEAPGPETQHRDVSGGRLRPAVFGAMDGLVTNVSLIAGVSGGGRSAPGGLRGLHARFGGSPPPEAPPPVLPPNRRARRAAERQKKRG